MTLSETKRGEGKGKQNLERKEKKEKFFINTVSVLCFLALIFAIYALNEQDKAEKAKHKAEIAQAEANEMRIKSSHRVGKCKRSKGRG